MSGPSNTSQLSGENCARTCTPTLRVLSVPSSSPGKCVAASARHPWLGQKSASAINLCGMYSHPSAIGGTQVYSRCPPTKRSRAVSLPMPAVASQPSACRHHRPDASTLSTEREREGARGRQRKTEWPAGKRHRLSWSSTWTSTSSKKRAWRLDRPAKAWWQDVLRQHRTLLGARVTPGRNLGLDGNEERVLADGEKLELAQSWQQGRLCQHRTTARRLHGTTATGQARCYLRTRAPAAHAVLPGSSIADVSSGHCSAIS